MLDLGALELAAMAKTSMEPGRTSAYSDDVGWRMVYQHEVLRLSYRKIARNLNTDHSTVNRVLARFHATGDVMPTQQPGRRSDLTTIDELVLVILENVIERPDIYLHKLQTDLLHHRNRSLCVNYVHILKRNNFSRQKQPYC